ncbi:hypothetical protein MJO29_004615 [Puccinia striiformis f. sp. tritici]|nr:hypothetical protein MJO29_004615 [Puccinia striiformis f. sp. tritici]
MGLECTSPILQSLKLQIQAMKWHRISSAASINNSDDPSENWSVRHRSYSELEPTFLILAKQQFLPQFISYGVLTIGDQTKESAIKKALRARGVCFHSSYKADHDPTKHDRELVAVEDVERSEDVGDDLHALDELFDPFMIRFLTMKMIQSGWVHNFVRLTSRELHILMPSSVVIKEENSIDGVFLTLSSMSLTIVSQNVNSVVF